MHKRYIGRLVEIKNLYQEQKKVKIKNTYSQRCAQILIYKKKIFEKEEEGNQK